MQAMDSGIARTTEDHNSQGEKERENVDMNESNHLFKGATVVDVDTLTGANGERVSYEEWLSKEIPRVTKGRVAYIDRESPFIFPRLDMTTEDREAFLDGLMPAIEALYEREILLDESAIPSGSPASPDTVEQASDVAGVSESHVAPKMEKAELARRLGALGALMNEGIISLEDQDNVRADLIKEFIAVSG